MKKINIANVYQAILKKPRPVIGAVAVIAAAAVVLLIKFYPAQPAETAADLSNLSAEPLPAAVDCQCPRRLDGACTDCSQSELLPYVVMIDNNIDARPSAGLAHAGLVYEAIAEGSITRFAAVFDPSTAIEKIGPVRSARPYYVDWAEEFGGIYAHVGGSEAALQQLHSARVNNLDQFYNSGYFWRDRARFAPHNVFTSTELLAQARTDYNWPATADYSAWQYEPESPAAASADLIKKIRVDFGQPAHIVVWQYDLASNQYGRSQGGREHRDSDGDKILAKNIVILYTKSNTIDDYGRRYTKTIGSGRAQVFNNGRVIEGEWRREKQTERTRFFDGQGQEIKLIPGTAWIEVLPEHFSPAEYE